jgi:hypothetical protein
MDSESMHGRFESRTPKPLKASFLSYQHVTANNLKTPLFHPFEYSAQKEKVRCKSSFDQEFLRQQEAMLRQIAEDSRKPAAPDQRDHPTLPPPTGSADHQRSDSDESNEDFCNFLDNEEMIREQQRIVEQIQRERFKKQEEPPRECRPSSAVDVLTECLSDAAKLRHATLSSSHSNYFEVPRRRQQQQQEKKECPNHCIVPAKQHQDQVVQLSGRKTLWVKGTEHTYKSIAQGTATIVQCASCQAVLQVGSSAKLVYCTNCQHVTPMELAREVASGLDSQIARSLQAQEIDVACARKLARLTRGKAAHGFSL